MLPNDLKYTKEHEWVKVEGENIFIGITDYAQSELGDIVFVELPDIGDSFDKDEAMGTIEAVKTVADIFCPIGGEVIEVNQEIENSPELVNTSPYNDGWLIKLKMADSASLDALLSSDEYKEIIS
tara:strand:+ start:544 stop:918 length:375 start_codon:yes stop_codon:yes gene_type:complete